MHKIFVMQWLKDSYELKEGGFICKRAVYKDYTEICERNDMKAVTNSMLGKLVKVVFPTIRTCRKGPRTNSRTHYSGLWKKTTPGSGSGTISDSCVSSPTSTPSTPASFSGADGTLPFSPSPSFDAMSSPQSESEHIMMDIQSPEPKKKMAKKNKQNEPTYHNNNINNKYHHNKANGLGFGHDLDSDYPVLDNAFLQFDATGTFLREDPWAGCGGAPHSPVFNGCSIALPPSSNMGTFGYGYGFGPVSTTSAATVPSTLSSSSPQMSSASPLFDTTYLHFASPTTPQSPKFLVDPHELHSWGANSGVTAASSLHAVPLHGSAGGFVIPSAGPMAETSSGLVTSALPSTMMSSTTTGMISNSTTALGSLTTGCGSPFQSNVAAQSKDGVAQAKEISRFGMLTSCRQRLLGSAKKKRKLQATNNSSSASNSPSLPQSNNTFLNLLLPTLDLHLDGCSPNFQQNQENVLSLATEYYRFYQVTFDKSVRLEFGPLFEYASSFWAQLKSRGLIHLLESPEIAAQMASYDERVLLIFSDYLLTNPFHLHKQQLYGFLNCVSMNLPFVLDRAAQLHLTPTLVDMRSKVTTQFATQLRARAEAFLTAPSPASASSASCASTNSVPPVACSNSSTV
jgi:hypothetical protein